MKQIITLIILIAGFSASAQSYQWAVSEGGGNEDRAFGMATDNAGNVILTGQFRSTANFGTTSLNSSGVEDIFLAKYDSDGNLLWAKQFGGQSIDIGYDVVTDAEGNCYLTGSFRQTAIFGTITLSATSMTAADAFVLKTDPSGNVLWVRKGGGTDWDESRGIAISGDNIYISGNFTGPATFDSITIDDTGLQDVYVASYSLAGAINWVTAAGGAGADFSNGITADSNGNSYFTGYFQGTATFGDTQIVNNSNIYIDMFVAKVNAAGEIEWAKRGGGAGDDDIGRAITTDSSGNIYVTGDMRGTGQFGSYNYTSAGIADIYVAKYDQDGNIQFFTQAGNDGGDYTYAIAASGDSIFVTGLFLGVVQFGNTTLTSAGSVGPVSNDIFLASLNAQTGAISGALRAGGNGSDAGRALAADGSGSIFQAGDFEHATASFTPFTLSTAGSHDVFVARINITSLSINAVAEESFAIFPNPATEVLNFAGAAEASAVRIYASTGQLLDFLAISQSSSIDTSFLSSGVYLIEFISADGRSLAVKRFGKM